MKGLFRTPLALVLLLTAVPAYAQSRNITTIPSDHLATLESLHQDAVDCLLRNDFQSALRAYEDILLLEPDDDTAYTGLGQIYMVQGRLRKAEEAFRNALQIDSDNEVALAGLQKIMDPDGVEGVVSSDPAQVERMDAASPTVIEESRPFSIDPGWVQTLPRAKRFGAVRGPRTPQAAIVETKIEKLHAQRVQMALKNAGSYEGPIDGVLGDATIKALRDFQKRHGLENTGSVNVATWNALTSYLDAGR